MDEKEKRLPDDKSKLVGVRLHYHCTHPLDSATYSHLATWPKKAIASCQTKFNVTLSKFFLEIYFTI